MAVKTKPSKGERTRLRLVEASAYLFHRRGYAAVGLNDILKLAKAPKGVLYHHFPNGKAGLGVAAIEYSTGVFDKQLQAIGRKSPDAASFIEGVGELTANDLLTTKFEAGCPLATVALETAPADPALTSACRDGFDKWLQTIEGQLAAFDRPAPRASAELLLTALEGALAVARTQQDVAIVRRTASQLAVLI